MTLRLSPGARVRTCRRSSAPVPGAMPRLRLRDRGAAKPGPESATSSRAVPGPAAVSGTAKRPCPLLAKCSVVRRACAPTRTGPEGRISATYSPAGPSTLSRATNRRERSPISRKRGRVALTTTGSRIVTSAWACPTRVPLQAVTITRPVPLKAGTGKVTFAVPSAPTFTTPENRASGASVGGASASSAPPASPPERIAPALPCMPSIR